MVLTRTKGGNSAFHNVNNEYLHIPDPNERRRLALAHIDSDSFGWNHVRAIIVAGIGFFTDAYGIFAINSITKMLGLVYWNDDKNGGTIPNNALTAIKVATPIGTIFGQTLFGAMADIYGRRRMYGIELIIIIVATIGSALTTASLAVNIVGITIFWRVVLGIGIGGDYPLSAVITSEFAPSKWRGTMMAAVFAMQGIGQLACILVALFCIMGFRSELEGSPNPRSCDKTCQTAADRMWKIIVGVGAIPACLALYYRITIPETPRYTFDIARDIYKAEHDVQNYIATRSGAVPDEVLRVQTMQMHGNRLKVPRSSVKDFVNYFGQWKNGKVLLGTCLSWFFLDIAFYGLGLNDSIILGTLGFGSSHNVYQLLYNQAVGTLIMLCAGALPGYWFTVAFVDIVGRRPLQLIGFVILTILFLIIGFAYNSLSKGGLLGLFVLAQFFFNFGPNATTFIIPGECFPTRYRATGHGLSAASGKFGAVVALAFDPLLRRGAARGCTGTDCFPWLNRIMQIFALFMLCGVPSTLLLPETKRRSLEDISGEDYLVSSSPIISARSPRTAQSYTSQSPLAMEHV